VLRPVTRALVVGAVAMLAGCGASGVAIEVVVPEGMHPTHLDLYVALDDCDLDVDLNADGMPDGCSMLRPPNGNFEDGRIYYLDTRIPLEVDGPGTYVFRLQGDQHVPAAIAVATDDQGQATGVVVFEDIDLTAGPIRLRGVLFDAEAFASGNEHGVVAWHTEPAYCVGAIQPDGALFVVDRDDQDCDGLTQTDATDPAQLECNPLSYLGLISTSNEFTCAAVDDQVAQDVCELGTDACVDGRGPTNCVRTNICTSTTVCSACVGENIQNCFDQTIRPMQDAQVACVVHIDVLNGTLGTCNAATTGTVTADLDAALFATGTGTSVCNDILFAPAVDPTTLDLFSYTDVLELHTAADPGSPVVSFAVKNQQTRCRFDLEWNAPLPAGSQIAVPFKSTVLLEVVNTSAGKRKLLMPLTLRFEACQTGLLDECTVIGPETVTGCIR